MTSLLANNEKSNACKKVDLGDAVVVVDLGYSNITSLGEMFAAIRKVSGKHSAAGALADMGQYLANDWADVLNGQRIALEDGAAA